MQLIGKKLQVRHYPQVPCKPFCIDVKDEYDAYRIISILANQHLFLYENNIIPDYANVILVLMWDESEKDWVDYYNEHEECEWNDFENYIVNIPKTQTT